MAISEWSTTAADNDTAGSINFAEGQAPSTVNNSARALMADVRTWYDDMEFRDFGHTPTYVGATQFSVTGDQTAIYTVGRPIRIADSSTLYGQITASSYSTVTTVTVSLITGSLSVSITAVALGLTTLHYSVGRDSVYNGVKAVQRVEATPITALTTITTVIPLDDTIPQNTEGDQVITVSITPKSTTNRLVIETSGFGATSGGAYASVAIFQDSTANALAANALGGGVAPSTIYLRYEMAAGTTSSTTFKVRMGPTSGSLYLNGGTAGTRQFGGIASIRLSVTEWEA